MVNQIEFHPGYPQTWNVEFCKAHGILPEAWSPLGRTRVLDDPFLRELAAGYGKSVAQLCLRFALQRGVLPLPKSSAPERMAANLDIFDFTDIGRGYGSHPHPAAVRLVRPASGLSQAAALNGRSRPRKRPAGIFA